MPTLACFPELKFCIFNQCRNYQAVPFLATGLMLRKIDFQLDSPSFSVLTFRFQKFSSWLRVGINKSKASKAWRWQGRWWKLGDRQPCTHSYTNMYVWVESTITGSCHINKNKIQTWIFSPFLSSYIHKLSIYLFIYFSIWIVMLSWLDNID